MAVATEKLIRFYYDRECTEEMVDFIFKEPVEVGDSDKLTRYMKNVGFDLLKGITLTPMDPEAKIQNIRQLKPGEIGEVVFSWSPNKERRIALNTDVIISYRRIIEP